MHEQREFEGIGYHYDDENDDCLLVSRWITRPADVTGQSVPVSKLLPRAMRCGPGKNVRISPPVTFRCRITMETDKTL